MKKELIATIRDCGYWALQMLSISTPGSETLYDLRFKKKDDSKESLGVTLTKNELDQMVRSYVQWEDEGNRLEDASKKSVLKTKSHLHLRERIAVLGKTDDEWSKEFNIVTFNGGAPKFNVSDWRNDTCRFGKSFTDFEMDTITEAYEATFGALPRKSEHWWE